MTHSLVPKRIKRLIESIRIEIECRKHKGNTVQCPICQSTFNIFKPAGATKRLNAKCYRCGSLERHRLMYLYLNNELSIFNQQKEIRVLHFAPKEALYHKFSEMDNVTYYPCDLEPHRYDFTGKSKIEKVDITSIPFGDDSFDLIICNHVLEHIPDDRKAMNELFRVMKPNGYGYFQVPIQLRRQITYEDFSLTTPKQRKKAFGQHDHVRIYGRDYSEKLKSVGFKVKEDDYAAQMSSERIFRFGLMKEEIIFFCQK